MTRPEMDYVQSGINYKFNNLRLLHQAFTRKSYSAEHPEVQNNEVLEFYGDGILDFFVTKQLYERFSKIVNNELISEKNEDELTKLKSIIVSKNSLARCMYNFGFSQYLYLGNSDIQNEVWKTESVNEDLFESIIGAVAADCNWDYSILEKVCKTMLQMETINNFLVILVKEKSHALGFGEPVYHQREWQINNLEDMEPYSFSKTAFGVSNNCTSKNPETGIHEYGIKIGEHPFLGVGEGLFQAKLDADRKAYHFLCREEIKRKFENIDFSNPTSTLHELAQKKVIMEVGYEFNEYHDENGNPIWHCKALLEGYGEFSADNVSKKQVKQDAAFGLLHYITDTVIETYDKFTENIFYSGECQFWSDEEKAKSKEMFEKRLKDIEDKK